MIKNQMTFPLAVDTATIKATTDILYTATDEQVAAYAIGFVPFDMLEESTWYKSATLGDFSNIGYNFSYAASESFASEKGVPFFYSYAQNASSADFNAYYDNNVYTNLPWGANSTTGLIHAYNTDDIVNNSPGSIPETTGITAFFKMFAVYLPDGSSGGASPSSGSNGWVSKLVDRNTTIDPLDLTFSVASGTDGSYMPTSVTFTEADLEDAVNGVMKKANGTTTYAGVTYNITVHCIISNAYLDQISANALKNGIVQLDKIRYSTVGSVNTPFYKEIAANSTAADIFSVNTIADFSIDYPNNTTYYMLVSDDSYEYFKISTGANHFLAAGFTVTDLKILRSTARPIYKISGSFYVAEFNDDYTITGDLIPYTQARAWQKNINGDDNTFDPADIPEPRPAEDEDQTGGVDWNPNTVFAVDSLDGFVTMYALRADQITRFGQYLWAEMWSDDFLNSIGVIFNQNLSLNPSEILNYIVSVRCYPFSISGMAGAAPVPDTIYLGRGAEGIDLNSGFNILRLSSYSEDIDGGTATIPAYYGDFRDYEPCSKITVFVPFCGALELAPSQVVGNKVHLRYCVDFSSGAIQATVSIEGAKNNYIAGILTGTVGATVELSASNLSQVIQKVGGLAFNVAKTAAMFAIGGEALEGAETLEEGSKALAPFTASAAETISSVADMSTGVPTTLGTTAGFSAFQVTTPIVRIERRHYEVPDNYAHVYGYACNYSAKLETLKGKGYTVCKNVDLEGVPATQDELALIESLLQSGVYF